MSDFHTGAVLYHKTLRACKRRGAHYDARMRILAILLSALVGLAAAPSGYFHVEKVDGRWWLIAPDGQRTISKGVTTVQFAQDNIQGTKRSPYGETNRAKYGTREKWRETAARRLIGWGFNTLGAWSDDKLAEIEVGGKRLAYAPNVDLGASFVWNRGDAWLHGHFPDVFDPEFEKAARKRAADHCSAHKNDPALLGWFSDNELRWGADWRSKDELLTTFLAFSTNAPGRAAAAALMRERHGADAATVKPTKEDCDAFLERLAENYFRITTEAIRAADPNHLVFGCRFAVVPRTPVIAAAAKYLNAISFNNYNHDPRSTIERYAAFGKPVIITECAFRGDDSGLPNTKGAGPRVKTQAERAAAYKKYVTSALNHPSFIGYHWFEHADEPKEGRFDGENSNYGLVNIKDEVYEDLTRAMTELNAQAETIHAGSKP